MWLALAFQLLTLTGPALVSPGAPVRLSLMFDPQGASVAGLQWTLDLPVGMSASFAPGAAAQAAGKLLACNGPLCLLWGMNQTAIAAGEIATVDVSPTVPSLNSFHLSGLVAATPDAQQAALSSVPLHLLLVRPWQVSSVSVTVATGL